MVSLLAESWTWYSIATTVVLVRCCARARRSDGIFRWQVDDWLMVLALCFYTVEIVSLNIVADSESNLLPPGYLDAHSLTSDEIKRREYGSKWVVVVEQCQCATVWLLKACFLLMYERFTRTTYPAQNLVVKLLLIYVAVTYVVMEVLYFTCWCRPFHLYWAVPTTEQCSAATNHLIINAVFNLTSDLAMLGITLPLFARSRLPFNEKASLCFIFGLAIFTIISAVLNKYYSFANPFGSEWTYWYCREASTAVLVANLPFVWGMVRKAFHLKSRAHEDGTRVGADILGARAKERRSVLRIDRRRLVGGASVKVSEDSNGVAAPHFNDECVNRVADESDGITARCNPGTSVPALQLPHDRRIDVLSLVESDCFNSKEDTKYFGRDDLI